jgi:hypothetical protein
VNVEVCKKKNVRAAADFVFESSLTVFFPAYNDAPSLPLLLQRTFETLRRFVIDYEVIVVNDGSYDDTAEVLEDLRREYAPHLRIVRHERNLGYGAALRSGFLAATKEYVFYTDGDGQYDPRDLEQLLRAADPETGLVNGYKIVRRDPWHRIAIGWLYNRFARWLFGIRLRDIDCDFRLIRRSAFDPVALRSTGGTICVELVRNLELSGAKIVELPVRHCPREHGRSQFFRVRSLAVTFFQLCQVFLRLVIAPALSGSYGTAQPEGRRGLSGRQIGLVAGCLVMLSFLAYARSLWLPFISDDYVQIKLSRDYGPVSNWGALAHDALYRCRATSLVMTYWIERAFGLDPLYFNVTSLLLHMANSLLVFALGMWRPIGWRVSAIAAAFFAINQRHSEAVIWFAAVPELLVFFFVLGSVLCWVLWLQESRWRFYAGALASYLLALLSKESAVAVVPLCALVLLFHPERKWKRLWGLTPFAAVAMGYFAMTYAARDTHLHFNDGTFSLSAPVLEVISRSAGGLLWVWGFVALGSFAIGFLRPWSRLSTLGLAWMVLALLPYSFLTYMVRVPSRHTYLASVGLSLVIAVALLALQRRAATSRVKWLVPTVVLVIFLHQCGYIWTVLHYRYTMRAEPTEKLLRIVRQSDEKVYANCFPYSTVIAEYALMVALPDQKHAGFEVGPDAAKHAGAQDFCNAVTIGRRY